LKIQEYQAWQEQLTAGRERFVVFPIDKAVVHVLSEHTTFSQAKVIISRPAVQLASRLIREIGYQHSAAAAVAVLEWFRSRFGTSVDSALYDGCMTACTINFAPEAALEVFSKMKSDGKHANIRVFNMLIGACVSAGYVDIALEVRSRNSKLQNNRVYLNSTAFEVHSRVDQVLAC
jgi:hypothetical protein